jgi:non-homologous end joining protein Ku
LKIGKIEYYTFPGDRKKYYRPSSFSDRMQNHLQMVIDEKKMVERMIDYRKKTTSDAACANLDLIEIYQEHILGFEKFLNKTIQKLEKVENK